MKTHKNIKSLLTDFLNQIDTASRNKAKTTTSLFIDNYIKENTFDIDANNELLEDLERFNLINQDPEDYNRTCINLDRQRVLNIINNVKHNNYQFFALQNFRRRK